MNYYRLISLICLLFLADNFGFSQAILHPSGNGTKSITVEPGLAYHYYDDGGPNGKYNYLTNSLLTIYPSKKGQYVSLKCNNIDINSDCRMYIFDGDHAGADILGYVDIRSIHSRDRMKTGDVFTATANNPSGALSVRFVNSKKREALNGWDFTLSCTKSPGQGVHKTSQDCSGAIKVCSNEKITTKASGAGIQELPGPYFWNDLLNYGKNGENQSNWYKFEVATDGTIEFTITPHQETDFDWALWGPYKAHECPAWTTDKLYRASTCDSDNSLITGLSSKASDYQEDSYGDGFVAPINVKKGEHYVLMIDDWSGNSSTFDLTWKFYNGASLECKKDKDPPKKDPPPPVLDTTAVVLDKAIVEDEFDCTDLPVFELALTPVTQDGLGGAKLDMSNLNDLKHCIWYDQEGKELSNEVELSGIGSGNYSVWVKDVNGCEAKREFKIKVEITENTVVENPQIKADLSEDEAFVTVSYPGPFEYKIENMEGRTVITGHSVDEDLVEITRLPPGQYRVSLIHKKIRQYDSFVKQ